jgi:hypothetical protein
MIERATLYRWLQLEEIKERIFLAAEQRDKQELVDNFFDYLSTATNNDEWQDEPWIDVYHTFIEVERLNAPTKPFPILIRSDKEDENGWTYRGRLWYYWLNRLASVYGWGVEQIKNLDIDDAIGLLQEILLDEQRERDFLWSASEIAYKYNPQTKKSTLQKLNRPEWMKNTKKYKEPKKTNIRKDFMPLGMVMRWEPDNAKSTGSN